MSFSQEKLRGFSPVLPDFSNATGFMKRRTVETNLPTSSGERCGAHYDNGEFHYPTFYYVEQGHHEKILRIRIGVGN